MSLPSGTTLQLQSNNRLKLSISLLIIDWQGHGVSRNHVFLLEQGVGI